MLHAQDENREVELEKSNIIMIGETGTGKTLLAKTIARELNVPFCIVDATILTEAGYVGEDVESILSRLLMVADYDVEKAEKGLSSLMRLIRLQENQTTQVLQGMFPEKEYSRDY